MVVHKLIFSFVRQCAERRDARQRLARIRQGLQRGEFMLYYQPKVDMLNGKVVGVEALLRWNHPEDGILGPMQIFDVPGVKEVMNEVGEWVIESGVKQMSEWSRRGFVMPVSVNVSSSQLTRPGFCTWLDGVLANSDDVCPTMLEIEILESEAIENIDHVKNVIVNCQGKGVRFALDDFGTAYSSLNYVKQLPAECLKIDQSFVRDMLHNESDMKIAMMVMRLADGFGRVVVAEGVESIEHGKALINMGCRFAQGYAIARPMPGSELEAWCGSYVPCAEWLQEEERKLPMGDGLHHSGERSSVAIWGGDKEFGTHIPGLAAAE